MALVLLNPHAGGGRAAGLAASLAEALKHAPARATLHVTASALVACALIGAAPRGERIVVVGGDGSLHGLLPALLAGAHETALIPAGSGDDSARAFGLRGLRAAAALAHALSAAARPVDLGEVHTEHQTRPFISSLCMGFDAAVAQRARAGPPWLAGLPRYLLATVQELAQLAPQVLTIDADGQRVHQGPALFASSLNTASYGGGMPAVPHARFDDGQLNLLIAGRVNRLQTLALLPRLLLGRHLSHREVHTLAFTQVLIQAHAAVALAADGEPMQAAQRVEVRVMPKALRVVVSVQ
jgi:diacylglycerol kinase (ATP)